MKLKRILPLLLAVVMVIGLTPMTAMADSQDPVNYVVRSWDETQNKVVETTGTCTDYELLHSSNSSWYTIGKENETTWYVAQGNITMNGTTLTVRGNVNIILCDGADVKIKDGIEVKTGYSLTIYGQAGDSGKLYAVNNSGDAGIGCGPNSGVGHITIHGGIIEAHGGSYAAGIGSGDERQMGSHITIYGGDIKAYGGDYGAGIGSGDETTGDNGYIDIYGGKVYAKGGWDAAGIGGGNDGNGRHITIWGGNITAESGEQRNDGYGQGAGIGGGDDGGGGYITINGGTVNAKSITLGPGIGGDSNCGEIVINGGTVTATSYGGAGIGGALRENLVKGSITINGGTVNATGGTSGGFQGAGIGSGSYDLYSGGGDMCVPITITGGTVTAMSAEESSAAGIGSGCGGNVKGQITIEGGTVTATSGFNGAGIGSGAVSGTVGGDVKTKIIISGGTVIARTNSNEAQAIGKGANGWGGSSEGVDLYPVASVTAGNNSDDAVLQTADKRLSGLKKCYAKIEPCEHSDKYISWFDDLFHHYECKYCNYNYPESHSNESVCVCGYQNPLKTVLLNSLEGTKTLTIHESTYYRLPFSEGQIITDGYGNYLRVKGWQKSGDAEAPVYEPGGLIFIENDISLDAVGDKVYGIRFAEMQNGSISTDQTIGDLTGAAAGEIVSIYVNPDNGYRVESVKYTVCAGEDPLLDPDTLQPVEFEITPDEEGKYQFVMPNVSEINKVANTLLITAEFEEIHAYSITCAADCTNGTISTDDVTSAYKGDIVRVYAEGNKGYKVSKVFVNGAEITPSANGDYFFTMPAEAVELTAVFTPVEYTITYELNDGVNDTANPASYTINSETITLAAPTKEGFNFLGWYDDEFFKNDVITEIAQGSTGDITLYAKWQEQEYVSEWALLQEQINSAEDQAVITLDKDYSATQDDTSLMIKNGKKLTIDLNGHTLNADGNAIRIFEILYGDLTITDSSNAGGGTIKGGNVGNSVGGAIIVRKEGTLTLNSGQITNCSASNGGAIALTTTSSLFTMNGGTISYNSASHGGGVHVQQGTFVMNGGSIKNNNASDNGGGLYATQNAVITLTGGRIEQNTAELGNIYLNNVGMKVSGDLYIESVYVTDPIITVAGPLAENSKIGLTCSNSAANNGKTLTSGLNGNGTLDNFFSAKSGYRTGLSPEGEIVMIAAPAFKTQSLVLSGQIGVNFFMDLSSLSDEQKAASYMTFAISGKGTTTESDAFDSGHTNDKGYYGFTCYVNSIQMADTITATFHYNEGGNENTVVKTYSVKEYIEGFDANSASFDAKTITLVHALADYGHYVQPFLASARGWTLGTDYATMDKYYTGFDGAESYDYDAIKEVVEDYAIDRDKTADIKNITYSLTLDSTTAINVYFEMADDYDGSFNVATEGLTATKQADGRYKVKIEGISAHELSTPRTIKVNTTSGESTVTVSALSYVNGILNGADQNGSYNAVSAIYSYSKAADDYKG